MIRIKRNAVISAKTVGAFDEYSRKEWKALRPHRKLFYARTHGLWTLYANDDPLCVIGVLKQSLIGSGIEVYFMLCRAARAHLRELIRFLCRAFRRAVKMFNVVTVAIEEGNATAATFIKFFKFRPVPVLFENTGIKYTHYELRASWLQQLH